MLFFNRTRRVHESYSRSHRKCPLGVEQLESRCLLAPWPIAPVNQVHDLYTTYGQFVSYRNIVRLHSGLDILAPRDTAVLAVEPGRYHTGNINQQDLYESYVTVDSGNGFGWTYFHTRPSPINPNTGQPWALQGPNSEVRTGNQLSQVVVAPVPLRDHVHLDYGVILPNNGLAQSAYNPLTRLDPITDNVSPTVGRLNFRVGGDDTNGALRQVQTPGGVLFTEETPSPNHRYFDYYYRAQPQGLIGPAILGTRALTASVSAKAQPGSADIDIIAEAYDQFTPAGYRLGIYGFDVLVSGEKWGDSAGDVAGLTFEGQFLENQNRAAFNRFDLTRTIYERDARSTSSMHLANYYILTNISDTGGVVRATDRARSWRSNAQRGSGWNDPTAAVAPRNSESAFRDDFYNVTVQVWDQAPNTADKNARVLLDNYQQTIQTSKEKYAADEDVIVQSGEQYSANQEVPLYLFESGEFELIGFAPNGDGRLLPNIFLKGRATTNNNGVVQPFNLRRLPAEYYTLIADYNQDGIYTPRLDAIYRFTVGDPKPPEVIPVRVGAAFNPIGPTTPDGYVATISWGDGSSSPGSITPDGTGAFEVSGTHPYPDNGTYTATLTLSYGEESSSQSVPVDIANEPPTLAFVQDQAVSEAGLINLAGAFRFTDPGFRNTLAGTDETFSYVIDWGDGSVSDTGAATVDVVGSPDRLTAGSFGGSHVYAQDGVYLVWVTVRDDDAGEASSSFQVFVNNEAPLLENVTVDSSIDENGIATVTGSILDPSNLDDFTLLVNWGDGEVGFYSFAAGTSSISISHQYLDDKAEGTASDDCTIELTLMDDGGDSDTDTVTVTVHNVAPSVIGGGDATLDEGQALIRSGSFTDPGADSWTATVDYGDGSGVQALTLNVDNTFALNHVYGDNGNYTITVRVVDDDSGAGLATFLVTVNNIAPTAEFSNAGPVASGQPARVFFANQSDPSSADIEATFRYSYDWNNDGDFDDAGEAQDVASAFAEFAFLDPGLYTVHGRIKDKDGGWTDYWTDVLVGGGGIE